MSTALLALGKGLAKGLGEPSLLRDDSRHLVETLDQGFDRVQEVLVALVKVENRRVSASVGEIWADVPPVLEVFGLGILRSQNKGL